MSDIIIDPTYTRLSYLARDNEMLSARLDLLTRHHAHAHHTRADMEAETALIVARGREIEAVTGILEKQTAAMKGFGDQHRQALECIDALRGGIAGVNSTITQFQALGGGASLRDMAEGLQAMVSADAGMRSLAEGLQTMVSADVGLRSLAERMQAMVAADAGMRSLAEGLQSMVSADAGMRSLGESITGVQGGLSGLASFPRDQLEWIGHVVTMGFDMYDPVQLQRLFSDMQTAVRHRSDMLHAVQQRVEVDFAELRVKHRPGGFTFHDSLVLAADLLSTSGRDVSVFDLSDWASKPLWRASDGQMYPLWFFVPRMLGVPVVVHPSGEGVQTVNFYQGTEDTKRRLARWITLRVSDATSAGHPVVSDVGIPVVPPPV